MKSLTTPSSSFQPCSLRPFLFIAVIALTSCNSIDSRNQEPEAPAPVAIPSPNRDILAGTGIQPNVVSTIEPEDYEDPFIRLNRVIFAFNDVSYRYAIIPAARTYLNVTPAPVRSSIGNFFNNIKTPITAVNHLLQMKPREAGVDIMRFAINSTIGIAGLFDPASTRFEMPRNDTGMSETLRHYGTGYGAYLVLPFIGSSNVRDGSSLFIDGYLNPLRYMLDQPESTVVRVFDNFQEFAPAAEAYLTLREESQDLYIFMRNLHLQGLQRDAEYQ